MRFITCILLVGGMLWGWVADAAAQETPGPQFELVTLQTESWVGEAMTWQLAITPPTDGLVEEMTWHPGDPSVWQLVDAPVFTQSLKSPVTLVVTAAALQPGTPRPALHLQYTLEGKRQQSFVYAAQDVNVRPVSDAVTISLLDAPPVRVNDTVTLTLMMRNGAPFTLHDVNVMPLEDGLAWDTWPDSFDLPAGEADYHTVTAQVRQERTIPRLQLTYHWRDDLQVDHTETTLLNGSPLVTREGIWAETPTGIIAVFLGVASSVLTTAFTRLVEQGLERKTQRKINRRHVLGLLNLMLTRSEYAATHSEILDLDPLEALMKEEPLYTTLGRYHLTDRVQALWKAGEAHNQSLKRPEGQLRSEQLRKEMKRVEAQLDALRKPWFIWRLQWLFSKLQRLWNTQRKSIS